MIKTVRKPTVIKSAGNKPKLIEEFFGLINTGDKSVSIARMNSPAGWTEPGQTPDFDEFTLVLKGKLAVTTTEGEIIVTENQGIHVPRAQWVRYSTPSDEGAEYIAICLPAFSPDTVNRDSN
jgi:ethanolamine utilization protein EutQ (cupin superfamily)